MRGAHSCAPQDIARSIPHQHSLEFLLEVAGEFSAHVDCDLVDFAAGEYERRFVFVRNRLAGVSADLQASSAQAEFSRLGDYFCFRNLVFCYNLVGMEYTYIRSSKSLTPGKHSIRYEFRKTGKELLGAGGQGRLYIDNEPAGEGDIPRTVAYDYSLDETFDIGCDKGSPVTDEYKPLAAFTGTLIKVEFDLKPDFTQDEQAHMQKEAELAMVRQ